MDLTPTEETIFVQLSLKAEFDAWELASEEDMVRLDVEEGLGWFVEAALDAT